MPGKALHHLAGLAGLPQLPCLLLTDETSSGCRINAYRSILCKHTCQGWNSNGSFHAAMSVPVRHCSGGGVRVEIQVGVAHVDEDGARAAVDDNVAGRRPCDRARDHLVPGPDTGGQQGEVHRGRAGGERDPVPRADVLGEAALELLRAALVTR